MRIFAIEEKSGVTGTEPGRALVVCTPEPPSERRAGRANAPFLTHLIATARRLPQTRVRRRVSFAEAAACYHSADAPAAFAPRGIVRSV